jgi:hypothetical protein
MHDQRIADEPFEDHVSEEDRDKCVLSLMLSDSSWPWTVDEIARSLDNEIGAHDSVARLVGDGLAHRLGELVLPTRAARRANEIDVRNA